MFVYKITNSKDGKVYIGVDTKSKRLQFRWRHHIRTASKPTVPPTKLYKAMHQHVGDFEYEVVFESDNAGELFLKEVELIAVYDSYHTGYNSTEGGDCFKSVIKTTDEYNELVEIFRTRQVEANRVKWGGTTPEERKVLTSHLHTTEVYDKKSKALQLYWDEVDEGTKREQLGGLIGFIEDNKEFYKRQAKLASDAARLKNIKSVTLQNLDTGSIHSFLSLREAKDVLDIDVHYIIKKHRQGKPDKKWKIIDDNI